MSMRTVPEGFRRRPGRKAAIYVRQSSPDQVLNNKGSRAYQLGLREVARELGYPDELIEIYEGELGMLEQEIHRQVEEHWGYRATQVLRGVGKTICAVRRAARRYELIVLVQEVLGGREARRAGLGPHSHVDPASFARYTRSVAGS